MELVHIHVVREEGPREFDVLAHQIGRTAQRHPGYAAAHVLADHFLVGMETARGHQNAALGVEDHFAFGLGDRSDARALKRRRFQKFNDFGVRKELDLRILFNLFEQLRDELRAARLLRAVDHVSAHEPRPNFLHNLLEVDADTIMKPLHGASAFIGIYAGELRIAATLRDLHHVFVEGVDRVGKPLFLLDVGVRGVEDAARVDRIAKRHAHFFKDGNRGALISSFERCGKARTACTDHDEIKFVILRLAGRFGLSSSGPKHCAAPKSPLLRASRRLSEFMELLLSLFVCTECASSTVVGGRLVFGCLILMPEDHYVARH